MDGETGLHPQPQRLLQRLEGVLSAVRIAAVIGLGGADDQMFNTPGISVGGGEGEENQIPPRHEGVGQAGLGVQIGGHRHRVIGQRIP
ncbi:MAG: hypothetical protein WCC69_01900, partial [Pirellulales bacterium]